MLFSVDDYAAIACRLAEIERAKGIAPPDKAKAEPEAAAAPVPERPGGFMYGCFDDHDALLGWIASGGMPA